MVEADQLLKAALLPLRGVLDDGFGSFFGDFGVYFGIKGFRGLGFRVQEVLGLGLWGFIGCRLLF